jgi:hypothetical protein
MRSIGLGRAGLGVILDSLLGEAIGGVGHLAKGTSS